ncbi:flagellar rod assembly protein/muramidase FlgJ [Kushneria pakistanensis]|uniref:Peptidoglycan hydrolase FlgJ n=1 Tax=Kushneria pakistanensis TaxID=1508770 RepID=A0ABQ3FQ04_9GAMM|nr:flagellar assembly peptidoglycan hydrolase FlgJ [Kushneria pakistanensis]GHC33611.1 flagellar rod assembly protein/muramidase FlgJ [Kushneria pakistanensis]
MAMDSRGSFALDVQGLSKLKYSARDNPQESLKETTQQFEALFLQKMLKSMRDAMPKSDLLKSDSMDTYTKMLDQQWAQNLSEQGIGLSDMMIKQLSKDSALADGSSPNDPLETLKAQSRNIPSAFAIPLSDEQLKYNAGLEASSNVVKPAEQKRGPLIEGYASLGGGLQGREVHQKMMADVAPHVSSFVSKMGSAARAVSERTGIPHQLILAQAALETGWGAKEIRTSDGKASHNLFNIKATGSWQGDRASVMTTEFEAGTARKERAAFRVYDSYEAAFSDYARLLTENPRYQPVLDARTPEAAAHALQKCGYATDPRYGEKLVSIMAQMPGDERTGPQSLYATRTTPRQESDISAATQRRAAMAYAVENEASRIF